MHAVCPAIISHFKTAKRFGSVSSCPQARHDPICLTITARASDRRPLSLMPIIFLSALGFAATFVTMGYQNYTKIAKAAKEVAILKVLSGDRVGIGAAQGRIYDAWDQITYAPTATATLLYTDSKNNFIAVDAHLRGQITPDVRTFERREKDGNPNCWVPTGATTTPKAYLCTSGYGD